VRSIAIPGAIGQIAVASILGTVLGLVLGWPLESAVVLGLSISVASTVVLIRALVDRGELLSAQGRIAVGWLIAEDLFTVVILVLLPSLAALSPAAGAADDGLLESLVGLVLAILKAGLFALIIVVIGVRLLPRLLAHVAACAIARCAAGGRGFARLHHHQPDPLPCDRSTRATDGG
jgi:monovalent cation:H+ antiporter-2, CPA2 family